MVKLQVCCLILLLFICGIYFSGKRKRSREHKMFVALLICVAVDLLVDMSTVYTVNHLERVSPILNRILHLLFLGCNIGVLYFVFLYIVDLIAQDIPSVKKKYRWLTVPPVIPILVMCFLPMYYEQTPKGNYAKGAACAVDYIFVAYYTIWSLLFLAKYKDSINKKKRLIIIVALGIEVLTSFVQLFFRYLLITSFGITMICLAIFLIVENPDVQLLERVKEEKKRAEKANSAKSFFLASMSHEIRTPINGVLGMNEMILRESGEAPIKEYAMQIKSAAQTLLGIINDILDFSKIESGKMELQPVEYELASVINDVYNMIASKADAKGLQMHVNLNKELPSGLMGDDVRIRQILMNLLTNAVKYTEKGSVTLFVDGKRDGDNVNLYFKVKDTGIGIEKENLSKLFVAFERFGEVKNRKIEGTGLGLTITRQFLEMMGSTLMVESEYGTGSEFSFYLKQKVINNAAIGNFEERIRQMAQEYVPDCNFYAPDVKILLVDDNEMNRKVFVSLLKETGMKIREADSGQACLDAVKEERFDIIFLDHMMPVMDGMETFGKMKDMPDNLCAQTPVIIFTANAYVGAREVYMDAGFDGFLSKPVLPHSLDKILRGKLPKELIKEMPYSAIKEKDAASANQIKGSTELPYIDGIDWEYAKLHFPDETLLAELATDFALRLDSDIKQIQKLCLDIYNEDGLKLYKTKLHALKSAAATIGAVPLSGLAKILEYAADEGNTDRIERMTPVIIEELAAYKQRLAMFLPDAAPKEKMEDSSTLMAFLEMLRIALLQMDMDQADGLMEQLMNYGYEEEVQVSMDELNVMVENMELQEAGDLIQKLMSKLEDEK